MANANNNQTDFAATSTSTDSSTSTGGKAWYATKLLTKFVSINVMSASDEISDRVIKAANFNGNSIDDGIFSKGLRLADSTDFKDVASLEVIEQNTKNIKAWLKKKRFSLIGSVKFVDLTQEQMTRVNTIVSSLRAKPRYADETRFSTKHLQELAFEILRKNFEDEASNLNKLEKEDEKALKEEYKRLLQEVQSQATA